MKAGLFGAAAAALVLSGCYYPGPYTYYPAYPPCRPRQPASDGAPARGLADDDDEQAQDAAQAGYPQVNGQAANGQVPPSQSQGQQPQQPPPGYDAGSAYYAYPAYPTYPVYPAYGYYPGYGYGSPYGFGAPSVAFGFSFGGHRRYGS